MVLKMCLNFEHTLKIITINKCLENGEDGYKVVEGFFAEYPNIKAEILGHASNVYCKDLILANQEKMPIWVMLEVISFGGLWRFCNFLKKKGYFQQWEIEVFASIANFRNAAAHSHCLFSQLIRTSDTEVIYKVRNYVESIESITKTEKRNNLKSKCINDFVTLIFAFEYYIKSEGIIKHTKDDINEIFYGRMLEHKEYFENCVTVKNAYEFVTKVLDKWLNK